MAAVQVAAGIGLLIQLEEGAIAEHRFDQPVVFLLGSIGPGDLGRPGQRRRLVHPFLDNRGVAHELAPLGFGETVRD
jgi:hypothetical protein